MTENDLIYLTFISCIFLPVTVGFLVSGIRFELGKIPAKDKREYIKRGTLSKGSTLVNGDINLLKGTETHMPFGIGALIFYLALLLQYHYSGVFEDGSYISWGFLAVGICFIIAMCRTMSKGTLMPRWAREGSSQKQRKKF
jgi:hypothetical protein